MFIATIDYSKTCGIGKTLKEAYDNLEDNYGENPAIEEVEFYEGERIKVEFELIKVPVTNIKKVSK